MEKAKLREFASILPYIRKYRREYALGLACLAAVDAAQIAIPLFLKGAVDAIASGDASLRTLAPICAMMLATAAFVSAGRFLWRFFIHGSSRRIEAELREGLFGHLMTLSPGFYQKNKIGDLMARASNDLNAVRMAIGMGLVAFADGTFMAIAVLAVMIVQDARTTALAVLPLPVVTALILVFGNAVGKRFQRVQEAYSSISDAAQETFAGMRVVKSFVKEAWFVRKFSDANDEYRDATMRLTAVFGLFFPLIAFLSGTTTLILLAVGGRAVIAGTMSPGTLVALSGYLQMLIWPMLGAGFTVNMLQRGAASLARVNEVLGTRPEIVSPETPVAPKRGEGRAPAIEVRSLSFAYAGGVAALDSVSFSVPRGSVLGLFGRTGSGKTTLLKMLPRLLDPPPATVFVDGVDVRDWDLRELRSLFGMTPQDTYLFSDSIKNNIAFGDSAAGEARLRDMVSLASLGDDLEDFAEGWDTVIGERGLSLSGGQKQRVSIARAVVRDPVVLLLDDALSAVDTATEARILSRLLAERRGKTTVLVSHRVSTLAQADSVVVLDAGRIAERGAPGDLLSRGGLFAEAARLQSLEGKGAPRG